MGVSLNLMGHMPFQLLAVVAQSCFKDMVLLHQREVNHFPNFKAAEYNDVVPVVTVMSGELQLQMCFVIYLNSYFAMLFHQCSVFSLSMNNVCMFASVIRISVHWPLHSEVQWPVKSFE